MKLRYPSLFHGSLIRFAAPHPDDADQMAQFTEDFDYMRRLDTEFAVPRNAEFFKDTSPASGTEIEFRLRTLKEDILIGFVALHSIEWNNQAAKLAIGIGHPEYRGKGYGSDSLQLILRYAFHELNLNRVGLDVIEYNKEAISAYEKAGFITEGRCRSAVLREGSAFDLLIMGVLKQEWLNKHEELV